MYQDAGYGQNWQPRANNASRIDPYVRSCKVLGGLFAVGFVLIVIVVLSLIPLYISHDSQAPATIIQAPKISINNYNLQFQSPSSDFLPQTILSDANNRRSLQAALTGIIQKDSAMAGSIVEINAPARRRRRQTSKLRNIAFDLSVICSKGCSSVSCLTQFQNRVTNSLTSLNQTTPVIRYQKPDSTEIYWLGYKLPQTIQSNATFIFIDPKLISSTLDTLTQWNKAQNQPTLPSSTPTIVA